MRKFLSSNWKEKYIPYYRTLEEILGDLIPKLDDEKIFNFVSREDWLLVPTEKEADIDDGKTRQIPNLYFALRENSIGIGIVCHTIPTIDFFKNITHDFHSEDKAELSSRLLGLDNGFTTQLRRKIKDYNPMQSPDYETVMDYPTNTLNSELIDELIDKSDRIREEGRELRKKLRIGWPPHTPSITLLQKEIPKTKQNFTDTVNSIRPIYEIILNIKTTRKIKKILSERERKKEDQEKKKYRYFVSLLNSVRTQGFISAEERREFDKKWRDEPDSRNEIESDLKKRVK